MGAYFTTQIFEPSNSKEVVAEFSHGEVPLLNHYAGLKFLESFYFFSRANMLAYFYLFLVSTKMVTVKIWIGGDLICGVILD